MRVLFLTFLCIPVLLSASNIHFAVGDWQDILASAQYHNKLIFVDGYTSWCKSCRWMDKNTFRDSSVAAHYNQHFINVKLDMEKGIGKELANKHQVVEYPVFLFIDGQGNLIKKAYGAKHPDRFLELALAVENEQIPDIAQQIRQPLPLRDLDKDRKVKIVYFVPSDRSPTENYQSKIRTLMTFVNDVYLQSFAQFGLDSDGLDFEFKSKRLDVHYLRADHKASYYNKAPDFDADHQWNEVSKELTKKLGSPNENLYIVFVETYDLQASTAQEYAGGLALGARYSAKGGLGIFSGWILQDDFCKTTVQQQLDFFADETAIKGRKAMGSRISDSPRYEFIEDGFGALAHELGHALGLAHDYRDGDNYIMGSGFRNFRNNYLIDKGKPALFSLVNTQALAQSPFLSPNTDSKDTEAPDLSILINQDVSLETSQIHFKAIARDNRELGAVIFLNGNTNLVEGGQLLTGRQQEFSGSFAAKNLTSAGFALEVQLWDSNGNLTIERLHISLPYTADPKAKPDFPKTLEIYSFESGSFRNMGNNKWKEFDKEGKAIFFFDEQFRNNSYIYLNDPSRGLGIQLPIMGGLSQIALENNVWKPFLKIWLSGGLNTGGAVYRFDGGRIETKNGIDWLEYTADNELFKFKWLRDNETYIYIKDSSRGMILKFPRAGGKMYFSTDEGVNWTALYSLTKE